MDKKEFGMDLEKSAEYIFNRYNNPLITEEIAIELVPIIKEQLNYCNNLDSIIDYSSFLTPNQIESVFMEDLSYISAKENLSLEEKIDLVMDSQEDKCLYKLDNLNYIFFNNTKE
ncbi:hypothetical protein [uncultured Methanobrevibacter sp.]|mgnify:CR=1 FL=1|uniref:hypothetical protein n=1 Tax=uncultured Methanobrevibacter sp. TaxID=253161 RepID=UPI00263459B9